MNEKLLYFIWQHQYFNKAACTTIDNEKVVVLLPGMLNTNQGPDFLNAKICIGETTWVGNVEIHVKSSDWILHGHSNDLRYKNVIAHVVYEHDKDIPIEAPTIELKNIIAHSLLVRYEALMLSQSSIACANLLSQNTVNSLVLHNWEDRLLLERFEQKSLLVLERLIATENHWEEICWQWIARYFGSVVNRDAFEEMAKNIPYKIIAKHKHNPLQVEAMLLGQVGLLDVVNEADEYALHLQKEFMFLKLKYALKSNFQKVQFLRLRPQNFPTIRLAQLAQLMVSKDHLFSEIYQCNSVKEYNHFFNVAIDGYWAAHYQIGKKTTNHHTKKLATSFIGQLVINAIVPLLFAYGKVNNDEKLKTKALDLLESLAAEKNHISKIYTDIGITIKTAAQSQSYIQLYQQYCTHKKCLHCAIGNYFLGKSEK